MRRSIVVLGFMLFLIGGRAIPAHAASLQKAPNNLGLIGYWSFEDCRGATSTDFSGQGHSGSLINFALATSTSNWVSGDAAKRGCALNFDGTDDYIDVGDALDMGTADMTISLWFKTAHTDSDYSLVSKSFYGGQPNRYGITVEGGALTALFNGNSGTVNTPPVTGVSDNTWHHVVVVYDRDAAMSLYVDGTVRTSSSIAADASWDMQSNYHLLLGRYNDASAGTAPHPTLLKLDGSMDEVRIYNRALQPSEISTLYQSGSAKTKAPSNLGLLGYWSMEDGRGDKVTDFSGRGNTGTLTNFALSTTTSNWNSGAQCARGACLNFDGVDDYVDIGSQLLSGSDNFTISTWIKSGGPQNTYSVPISQGHGSAGKTGFAFQYGYPSATDLQFVYGDGVTWHGVAFNLNLASDTAWHHIVTTKVGLVFTTYKDGIQQDSQTASVFDFGSYNLSIGRDTLNTDANHRTFKGSLDEVRVYSRALSPTEITSLYGAGTAKINVSRNNKVTNGLVGLWSFDGPDLTTATATDRSGSGLDGTRMGGISPTIGKIGQGMNLDGGDDYIAVPSVINSRASSSFSVSLWTKNNVSPGQYDGIISETDGGGWHYGFGMYYDSATQLNFFMDLWSLNFVTSTINPLEWNHIVGTWDGTTMHLYVNGVLSPSTDTYTGGPIAQVYPFEIGRVGDNAYNINGKVDDVRVYNRALTQSEITELYNLGR